MIQPTDEKGNPVGVPTVLPGGKLTVTTPERPPAQTTLDKETQKLEAKKMANQPKELKLLTNTEANFDRMIQEAEDIKSDPSLGSALDGQCYQKLPATDARRVKSRIDTQSKTGFTVCRRCGVLSDGWSTPVSDRKTKCLRKYLVLRYWHEKGHFINSLTE
ncbi:MAG: hypothetical protein IPJ55_16795 [Chloracidobacterium sp.]|nr:hypothetical protein [Chloracidobacterium sp.]